MGKGTRDKAEGKWDELKGKAKEKYGEATDNPTKDVGDHEKCRELITKSAELSLKS